ncbi:GumC family protein [Geomonas limicola]|uniref:GumC family protein n=1 Tax=Geomonas limicola TaxID=2740186 RepID=UPI001607B74E|nr:GumC family protein [Geomonas limicola]
MKMRDFLNIIFKHWTKILTVVLSVTAVSVYGAMISKPVYLAKSSFLVKPWREDAPRPGMDTSNNTMNVMLSQDELVNTEIQVLTGRELAEKVVRVLKVNAIYPNLVRSKKKNQNSVDAAVEQFGKHLKVTGVRKSNVVEVSFQHNDPKIAAKALNLLIDTFKEKHLALHSDPQSYFIATQMTSFENKLKDSERNLQTFQQTTGVFSLEEQRSLLLKQRSDLDTALKFSLNSISELRNRIVATKSQLTALSKSNSRYTPTERDKIVIEAKTKLLELRLKEQELKRKYNEKNPLVVEAKREVDLVNQFLLDQEEGISGKVKTGNPVYQNVEIDLFKSEGELNSQLARAEALKRQVKQLDNDIADLDSNETKLQNLKRQVAINEKNYKTYADKQEEARMSEAMNRLKLSNISIIQNAEVPAKPESSNRMMKIVVGAIMGLFSGMACGYLAEMLGQTFSDPESVEMYLDIPVVLTVPYKEA